jgi:hypothetical protein
MTTRTIEDLMASGPIVGLPHMLRTPLLVVLACALLVTPMSAQGGRGFGSKARGNGKAVKSAPAAASQGPPTMISLVSTTIDFQAQLKPFSVQLIQGSQRTNFYQIQAPSGITGNALKKLLNKLSGLPGVLVAELDQRVFTHETESCIDDGLGGVGQAGAQQCTVAWIDGTPTLPEYISQTALEQIDAITPTRFTPSYTPVVAVIDTGIDPSHPVFEDRLAGAGYDFITGKNRGWDKANGKDDDGDGLVDEGYGHGTHIAGAVLAVDPYALILPIRVLDSEGNGSAYNVATGILWAVDQGADVINLSLSMLEVSETVAGALQYAEAHGVLVFTSAGNTGDKVLFPGNYDPADISFVLPGLEGFVFDGEEIVTVAAVNDLDVKAAFSAWGVDIDVCAPGVAVYSALPDNHYGWWSGTSMATALVSGTSALAIGLSGPTKTSCSSTIVTQNALPIDHLNPVCAGGLGSGRVDALASALDALLP